MRPDRTRLSGGNERPLRANWLGKGEKDHYEWGFRFYSRKRANGTLSARPNRISAYIWNADGKEGAGAYFEEPLTKGQWLHVVAVYQPVGPGAGVLIYRDGVLQRGLAQQEHFYSTFSIPRPHIPGLLRCGWGRATSKAS